MKIFLILLPALFALGSCEKGKDLPEYPVTMTFDTLEATSEMRVFTSDGTMLDNQRDNEVIADFLDRYYTIGSTHYNSRFLEPANYLGDVYEKAGFTFYEDDRITYAATITDLEESGDVTIMKSAVSNRVEDNPIVTSDFFKFSYDIDQNGHYYAQYVVRGDRSKLDLSLLYYKLVRYDENGKLKSVDFGTAYNELNEAFIRTLGTRDTLAVKTYRITYSAK